MSRKFNFHQNLTRITGAIYEDLYTFMIISRIFLVRMRNVTDNRCIENQNTHFLLNNFSPSRKYRLRDNVEKYGRAREATALCMLDNVGCRHTLTVWNTYCFSTEQELREWVLMLRLCVYGVSFLILAVWTPPTFSGTEVGQRGQRVFNNAV